MECVIVDTHDSMSRSASDILTSDLEQNLVKSMILASGNTPTLTYKLMIDSILKNGFDYSALKLIMLDEWYGLDQFNTASCNFYFKQQIFSRLINIADDNFIWNGCADNSEVECNRIEQSLKEIDIDICILGIGVNGHIGFNEPSEALIPYCHKSTLSYESLNHSMILNTPGIKYGLTLGMFDIMRAKKVILLASGENKSATIKKLFSKKITTQLPASFLWMHNNATVIIDKAAAQYI